MLKMVGNSGQISLGKKYAGKYFEMEHQPDGAVLLRPMQLVPAGEAWVHAPAMREQLRRADEWAARTPPSETVVEKLIKGAGKRSRARG